MSNGISLDAKTLFRDVETAGQTLRRYYRTVKETMRAMAGYLPKMCCWPGKKLLARHIWLDAMHADMLRSRTLELRYPRVDVDDNADLHLIRILDKLPTAPTDEHFLIGVYGAVKPLILHSLQQYVQGSDPLDDAPTIVFFRRIIDEMTMELEEFNAVMKEINMEESPEIVDWRDMLEQLIASCGGLDGPDREIDSKYASFLDKPDYQVPMEASRDLSWEQAVMQSPPRPPKNFVEKQIWVAIDHANELWAAETPAALIWEYKNMPWQLYFDAARWCYDEMRHSMMGVNRLSALGLEVGVDYPMVPDHWKAFRHRGLNYVMLLLHRLEQGGPKYKSRLREEFSEAGDFDAAQDCDYDWADESGHISYGLAWLKAVFPDWSKQQIIDEGNRMNDEWRGWIASHRQNGTHGYEKFMERIEKKVEALVP